MGKYFITALNWDINYLSAQQSTLYSCLNEWLSFASSGKLNAAMSGTRNAKWMLCCTNARILEIVCTFQMAFIHKNKMLPRWKKWRNKNVVPTSVFIACVRKSSMAHAEHCLKQNTNEKWKMNRNFHYKKIKKIWIAIWSV